MKAWKNGSAIGIPWSLDFLEELSRRGVRRRRTAFVTAMLQKAEIHVQRE
jgi:hypothetical protein